MSSETGWQRLISLAFAAWGPTFQEIRWYFGAIQRKSSYLTTWLSRLSFPESRHISLNGLACQHIVCRKTRAAWQPQMLLFLNHCFCRCSGAQEAISSSLGKRRDGWIRENDDGDALNWALGEGRVSGCPLVREWDPSLPGLPLQSPLVKLFNRKTRAYDFYQCAFLAPVSLLCLNSHSASSCSTGWMGFLKRIQ